MLYSELSPVAESKWHKSGDTKQINVTIHQFVSVFSVSMELKEALKSMLSVENLEEHHLSVGINSILHIQDIYCHTRADQDDVNVDERQTLLPPANEVKVRYVSGMCVGKALHKHTQYVCRNIYESDASSSSCKWG